MEKKRFQVGLAVALLVIMAGCLLYYYSLSEQSNHMNGTLIKLCPSISNNYSTSVWESMEDVGNKV